MYRRFGRVPPLSALRGFEAAARLASFSKAAAELNMTQSAVSHQVRLLEDFLGQPLFLRIGRAVQLTDAGRDFLQTTGTSLDLLARGTRKLDAYLKPGSVIITTSAAFAGKWLIPRFQQLQTDLPELQPWLFTTDERTDLENAELDIAIWRGDGKWPGLEVVKLMDDWLTPMAAKQLLPEPATGPVSADLPEFRLLHDERQKGWHDWFARIGVERADLTSGFNFSDSGLLIDSAVAGLGVALGSLVLADRHLVDGSLVRLFPDAIPSGESYYAVCMAIHLRRPAVRDMWNWLVKQGNQFQVASAAATAP